jgi:quinol monooxygenase YgiN
MPMSPNQQVGDGAVAHDNGVGDRPARMSLTLTASVGGEQEMLQALRSVMLAAQVEPACVSAQLFREVGEPQAFRYVEEWRDEEHLERRIRSRAFSRLLALMETAPEAPVLEFYVGSEVRGLAYVAALRDGPLEGRDT